LQCTYNILEYNNSVIQKRATKFVIAVDNRHEKSANSIILRCTYNILEYNNSVRLYKKRATKLVIAVNKDKYDENLKKKNLPLKLNLPL